MRCCCCCSAPLCAVPRKQLLHRLREAPRQGEGLEPPRGPPRAKVARLAVVAVVGQGRLGADEQDSPVEAEDANVVPGPGVRGDEADVDQDGAGGRGCGRDGGAVVAVAVASSPAAALVGAVEVISIAALPVGDPGAQQLGKAAPRVVLGIGLEEVVLAAVARQLELGADLVSFLKKKVLRGGGRATER